MSFNALQNGAIFTSRIRDCIHQRMNSTSQERITDDALKYLFAQRTYWVNKIKRNEAQLERDVKLYKVSKEIKLVGGLFNDQRTT